MTQGKTLDELMKNIKEAVELYLEGENWKILGCLRALRSWLTWNFRQKPVPKLKILSGREVIKILKVLVLLLLVQRQSCEIKRTANNGFNQILTVPNTRIGQGTLKAFIIKH